MSKIKTCEGCNGKCCRYVVIGLYTPESLEDFDDMKWYVLHKNICVFVDEDYEWHLEFLSSCEHLNENGLCGIYEKRPEICRKYSQDECPHHNDYEEIFRFEKLEDIEKYIKEVFEKGGHVVKGEE